MVVPEQHLGTASNGTAIETWAEYKSGSEKYCCKIGLAGRSVKSKMKDFLYKCTASSSTVIRGAADLPILRHSHKVAAGFILPHDELQKLFRRRTKVQGARQVIPLSFLPKQEVLVCNAESALFPDRPRSNSAQPLSAR